MKKITEKELFKAGAHFGHKTSTWHPKMEKYIYGQKNGVHIFNLSKTRQALEKVAKLIEEDVAQGKQILFVGTKIQAKEIVEKKAKEVEMPFVIKKWLGGTLTNFSVISKKVKKLKQLREQEKDENYTKKYSKKERLDFSQEIEDLEQTIGGIKNMDKVPDLIFVSSARYEKTPLREAKLKGVTSIAICDSNTNPEGIDYPIPANDDSLKTLELIVSLVAQAAAEGKKKKENKNNKKSNNK